MMFELLCVLADARRGPPVSRLERPARAGGLAREPAAAIRRLLVRLVLVVLLAPPALLLVYRFLPVPITPLMLIRLGARRGAAQGLGAARGDRAGAAPGGGRGRGQSVLRARRLRLGGAQGRGRSAICAPASGRAAPARSPCRPPRTCSCGPTAACCARGSRPGSRRRSSCSGPSAGSSRSISTSPRWGPASMAPRPPRAPISASRRRDLGRIEAALLAAVLPNPAACGRRPDRPPIC